MKTISSTLVEFAVSDISNGIFLQSTSKHNCNAREMMKIQLCSNQKDKQKISK